jgi:hypothetical protein
METTVTTTWHDPGLGWLTLPAGTPCRLARLEEMPAKEQRALQQMRRRNASLVLIFLANKFRALPNSSLRKKLMREQPMVDPTERELAAMKAAGPMAGEYIESLGKTDLALFTVEEFLALIQVIVTAYLQEKAKLDINNTWDDVPF